MGSLFKFRVMLGFLFVGRDALPQLTKERVLGVESLCWRRAS